MKHRYTLVNVTDETEGKKAGTIEIDDKGIITLITAEGELKSALPEWIAELNKKEEMMIPAPPPDDERYSKWGKSVSRDDPTIVDAVITTLQRHYGLQARLSDNA